MNNPDRSKKQIVSMVCAFIMATGLAVASIQADTITDHRETAISKGFFWNVPTRMYDLCNVCAVVEVQKGCTVTRKSISLCSDKSVEDELIEFKVKVIDGAGIDVGAVRQCFTLRGTTFSVDKKYKRFLLLGWASREDNLKVLSKFSSPSVSDLPSMNVNSKALFTIMLVPTK